MIDTTASELTTTHAAAQFTQRELYSCCCQTERTVHALSQRRSVTANMIEFSKAIYLQQQTLPLAPYIESGFWENAHIPFPPVAYHVP